MTVAQPIEAGQTELTLTTSHTYDKPGVYFATARVTSHRQGDLNATDRLVRNLASARIVVG